VRRIKEEEKWDKRDGTTHKTVRTWSYSSQRWCHSSQCRKDSQQLISCEARPSVVVENPALEEKISWRLNGDPHGGGEKDNGHKRKGKSGGVDSVSRNTGHIAQRHG